MAIDDDPQAGPDAAGAIVPPRDPEDGTPTVPKPDPRQEPHMTDEAADAIETPVTTAEDVPQP
ncbi:MAG TPA: hypothetical protein VM754_13770 [Actinomycetota bacterium]|nr:hypothetical protein [Actinomycetota bacterium]